MERKESDFVDVLRRKFGDDAAIRFCVFAALDYLWRAGEGRDVKDNLVEARRYIDKTTNEIL